MLIDEITQRRPSSNIIIAEQLLSWMIGIDIICTYIVAFALSLIEIHSINYTKYPNAEIVLTNEIDQTYCFIMT